MTTYLTDKETAALRAMGQVLRAERIARNETQAEFCRRLGVSRNTLSAMENGAATVSIDRWLRAASVMGCLEQFSEAFMVVDDPFAAFARQKKAKERQRVRRR
ncbi:MAG: helix-turn-helix transcriptional regulator [Deltaproteobacteria bacterium]|nr:helix-turn-helix transcriptional regulator [Deltaproteobacteria bacterium]